MQVVAGKKIDDMGRQAVMCVRLPLLSLEEIGQLEEENKKDHFVPVSVCVCVCVVVLSLRQSFISYFCLLNLFHTFINRISQNVVRLLCLVPYI